MGGAFGGKESQATQWAALVLKKLDPIEPVSEKKVRDDAEQLRQLRRAIVGRHSLRFRYYARQSQDGASAQSTRTADPYGLVHVDGAWHLVAYCHLRQDIRHFRVERMDQLAVLPQTFTRPADFTLEQRENDFCFSGRNTGDPDDIVEQHRCRHPASVERLDPLKPP